MQGKKLVIFDLDGTLAERKSEMDEEMSKLLSELLDKKSVAVISGGSFNQFMKQFLSSLDCPKRNLRNLFLFPTCSTSFYKYENEWINVYSERLSKNEKIKIKDAFEKIFSEMNYKHPDNLYGEVVEDRDTQITFSALGQKAPIELKQVWDPNSIKRLEMKKSLDKYLPEFEVRVGGSTSIDVTKKGIDKEYGINKIQEHLGFNKEEMLFIGDALFEGGNDYPVKKTGIECIAVNNPEDTKKIIRLILKSKTEDF